MAIPTVSCPAFTASATATLRYFSPLKSLSTQRAPRAAARRRPRPAIRAVFIWSSDFDEEAHDDEASEDAGETHELKGESESDSYDENFLGDAWRRSRASTGDVGGGGAGPVFGVSAADEGGVEEDMQGRLYRAVRRYSNGPDDVTRLRGLTTDCAADAFRRVVMGILGTIPGDAYEIVITSDRGGVSRLMQSSLSTGYALRNAEFRMALNDSMDSGRKKRRALDRDFDGDVYDLFSSEPDYLRSVPRRGKVDASAVEGTVRWWDSDREMKQEKNAADYIAKLEAENELLRERLGATQIHDANSNKLMDFMRTLNPDKISSLQANLSPDAIGAFKQVVKSVLGELSPGKVQVTYSTSRDYLAQLTFWCLLVGYSIRNFEKRFEMTKVFDSTQDFAEPSLRDFDFRS